MAKHRELQRQADRPSWRTEHIGFIFQIFNLIPVLTAFENIELPLLLSQALAVGATGARDDGAPAGRALERPGESSPKQLSGGQEQRVAIAARSSPIRRWCSRTSRPATWTATSRRDPRNAEALNGEFHEDHRDGDARPHAAAYAHTTRHLEKGMLLPQIAAPGIPSRAARSDAGCRMRRRRRA